MKWARRYRARLRAAARAALGAWRDVGNQQARGVLKITWSQEVTEQLIADAVFPVEDYLAHRAKLAIADLVRSKRKEMGVVG